MAYLIRSKGRPLVMRDKAADGMPVYEIGVKDWVLFSDLPENIGEHGDADVEVKMVTDKSDVKAAEKAMQEAAEKKAAEEAELEAMIAAEEAEKVAAKPEEKKEEKKAKPEKKAKFDK